MKDKERSVGPAAGVARRLATLMANLPGVAYRCVNDEQWTMEFLSEGDLADITKRKQSEERFRLMVEHLPTGAVFKEDDRLLLNRAAEEITGYTRDELSRVDDWFRRLYGAQHEERKTIYEESRASGFSTRRLLPIRTKDGQQRWVEFAAYAYETGEVWLLHDITDLKKTEDELRAYQKQLRTLASELTLAEDRERRRIAADLHDGLGQTLSMAHVKLEMLRELQTGEESLTLLEEARRMIDQAIGDTRAMTFSLSSPVLQQMGLVPALEQLCEDMNKQYGGKFSVQEEEWPKPLGGALRMILFRCVRELLINVAKHAEASQTIVCLTADKNVLQITVNDDGAGFDTSRIGRNLSPSGGFGLFNMHEYLNHMGGSLDIQSTPGKGTHVRVVVPLQTAHHTVER